MGRALGIDLQRIEAVSKSLHWFDSKRIGAARLRENGFDPDAPVTTLWIEFTQQLIGFPRHLSQHPGGFVVARDRIEQLVHHSTIFEPHQVESYRCKVAAREQKLQRDNDKAQRNRQSSGNNDNQPEEPHP